MVYAQINAQTESDLLLMESIAIPLSFLVLVWVFGGLVAAALPMAVGGFAIVGSMSVLRLITFITDVSIFALNLSTAHGSGAGDRLHPADHQPLPRRTRRRRAARRGADPDDVDRGPHGAVLGDDGRAVDGRDAALPDVLPEVLRLRGHRDGRLRRAPRRSSSPRRRSGCSATASTHSTSAGSVRRSLGRPEPVPQARRADVLVPLDEVRDAPGHSRSGSPSIVLLLVLGAPFLGVKWGFPDDRVLPTSASAHQVGDQLRDDFADDSSTNVTRRRPRRRRADAQDDRATTPPTCPACPTCRRCPPRPARSSTAGRVGRPSRPPVSPTAARSSPSASTAPLFSDASETHSSTALHAVAGARRPHGPADRYRADQPRQRRTPSPPGCHGCSAVIAADHVRAAVPAHRQCRAAAESVVLNVLSLTAAFGALVWIFQDGHLGALGTTPTGTLVANYAGAVVLHRLRAVDGLRGVPRRPDPGVLARGSAGQSRPSAGRCRARAPTTTRASRSGWPAPAGSSPRRRCSCRSRSRR